MPKLGVGQVVVNIPTSDGFNLQGQITALATVPIWDRGYSVNGGLGWLIDPAFTGPKVLAVCREAGMKILVNYHRLRPGDISATFVADLTTMASKVEAIVEVAYRGPLSINIVGQTEQDVDKTLAWFKKAFPSWRAPRVKEEPKSHVNFWMMTNGGPAPMTRLLDVTTWKDVEANYPSKVRSALNTLINFQATKSGQIVMLHGNPGVGKTWLLRALAWEWQPWCSMHYVMDPDQLLNGSPSYMTELLFSQSGPEGRQPFAMPTTDNDLDVEMEKPVTAADTPEFTTKPRLFGGERWRLIILEDTGELMTVDAANRTGQGLGRLLNAADGMLGQGSRVLFLITTNEPLEKIHPAVARPGRALANIHFDPFPASEAVAWIKERGGDPEKVGKKDLTLAEMYALLGTIGTKQVVTAKDGSLFGFMGEKGGKK